MRRLLLPLLLVAALPLDAGIIGSGAIDGAGSVGGGAVGGAGGIGGAEDEVAAPAASLDSAWLFYDGANPDAVTEYPDDLGTLNLGVAAIAGSPTWGGATGPGGSTNPGAWTYNSQATSNGQRHYDGASATNAGSEWTIALVIQPWGNQSNHIVADLSDSTSTFGARIYQAGAVTVTFATANLSVTGSALTNYLWYVVVATNGSGSGETLHIYEMGSDTVIDSDTGAHDTTTVFGDQVDLGSARSAPFWSGCQCNIAQLVVWNSQEDPGAINTLLRDHHGL